MENNEILFPSYTEFKESKLNEEKDTVIMDGATWLVDFIKVKSYDRHESPSYHLLLKNQISGEILAWPNVFSYTRGYSQGSGPSKEEWFLTTQGYGGKGNGSGQSSPSTPYYVRNELEYIVNAYLGKGHNKDMIKWYQENASTFKKGTKKEAIARSLS